MLEQIEDLAYKTLSIEEIAVLVDVDVSRLRLLIDDQSTDEYRAFARGRARIKRDLFSNIVDLAKKGSPQAEQLIISKLK